MESGIMQQDEKQYFELNDSINKRIIRVPRSLDSGNTEVQLDQKNPQNLIPLASELLSKAQHTLLVLKHIGLIDEKNVTHALGKAVGFINTKITEISNNPEFQKKSTAEKNKYLDKLRPKLTQMVIDNVEKELKIRMDSKNENFEAWQTAWETLPSNYYNIKRVDNKNNITSTITGSKHSSHNKHEWGSSSAWRKITLEEVSESKMKDSNPFIFYRVPSLANLKTDEQGNIAERIKEIHADAGQMPDFKNQTEESKPLFYILMTSFHDQSNFLEGAFDSAKNKQNRIAKSIFKEMHIYNRQIYSYNSHNKYAIEEYKKQQKHYCYVQNLGVNMHSANLSNASMSETVKEATLLADLSFVNNLFAKDINVESSVQLINNAYDEFLSNPNNNDAFFHSTEQGKRCIKEINSFKTTIENQLKNKPKTASDLLKHAFAKNLHYDQELGNIIQTLSILSQHENGHISMGGCKSANERLENILNQIYMEYSKNSLSKNEDIEIDKKFFQELSDKFNKAVNENGGYTPMNMISITDNGPSKLEKINLKVKQARNVALGSAAISLVILIGLNLIAYIAIPIVLALVGIGLHVLCMNTNNSASTVLTNQYSKYASKTQTHKMYKSDLLKSAKKSATNPIFLTLCSVLCLAILFNQGTANAATFATFSKEIAANFVPVVAVTATILSLITILQAYKSKKNTHLAQKLNKVLPTALASAAIISLEVLIGTNILTLEIISSPLFIGIATATLVIFTALFVFLDNKSSEKYAVEINQHNQHNYTPSGSLNSESLTWSNLWAEIKRSPTFRETPPELPEDQNSIPEQILEKINSTDDSWIKGKLNSMNYNEKLMYITCCIGSLLLDKDGYNRDISKVSAKSFISKLEYLKNASYKDDVDIIKMFRQIVSLDFSIKQVLRSDSKENDEQFEQKEITDIQFKNDNDNPRWEFNQKITFDEQSVTIKYQVSKSTITTTATESTLRNLLDHQKENIRKNPLSKGIKGLLEAPTEKTSQNCQMSPS